MTALRVLTAVGSALALVGAVHQQVNLRSLRVPAAEPAARGRAGVGARCPLRDEAHRIAPTAGGRCWPSAASPTWRSSCWTTAPPTAPPTSCAARGRGDPRRAGPARHPARRAACRASRTPAPSSRPRPAGRVLVFVDADVRARARTRWRPRSRCCAAPGSTCCPRGRASSPTAAAAAGAAAAGLVVVGRRCRCAGPSVRAGRRCAPANGQFLVVDAAALATAGGFAAVAGAVLDDLALARAVKRAGAGSASPTARGSPRAACTRAGRELRAGYRKSLWAAFGPARGAWRWRAALALAYLVPPLAALRGSRAGLVGLRRRGAEPGARRRPPPALAGVARRARPPGVRGGAARPARCVVARAPAGQLTWKGRPLR